MGRSPGEAQRGWQAKSPRSQVSPVGLAREADQGQSQVAEYIHGYSQATGSGFGHAGVQALQGGH